MSTNGKKSVMGVPKVHLWGAMEEFATAILECGLMDAGYEGNQYSWANSCMFQRLDRVLYNMEWSELFSITRVQHLTRAGSDQAPLSYVESKRPTSFRF
ncbi:Uncharacterized protein TCM_007879 [Theobroma cacao]|uniref:Uncharacterized protein n=1 Tax=Theobroma cacao TaxID=3641 RepID=A0A061E2L6_THECC|nr:Uncharacterized protein TCM_007879 [Theobroma cacao]